MIRLLLLSTVLLNWLSCGYGAETSQGVGCVVDKTEGNCEDAMNDYLKNVLPRKRDRYSKEPYRVNIADGDCFLSEAYALLADEKGFESLGDQLEKFIAKFAQAKDPKIFLERQDLPFQKPAKFPSKKWNDLRWKWDDDQSKLRDIVLQTTTYNATGEDCFNEGENATITSDQNKLKQDGYTQFTDWYKTEAQCQIDVCKLEYVKPCGKFLWAEWGPWEPCEKRKCDEIAIKKRTRICMTDESCGEKEKVSDSNCPPYVDQFNQPWTNTIKYPCSDSERNC